MPAYKENFYEKLFAVALLIFPELNLAACVDN